MDLILQSLKSKTVQFSIAYDQVTEAECLAWCKAEMGEEQVTSIEDGLTANIELQKNPVDGNGVPW